MRLGSTASYQDGTLVDIVSFLNHPKYTKVPYLDNDLAIISLKTFVKFSKSIAPILMAAEKDELKAGEMVLASGWGQTCKKSESPEFLRAVSVPIVSIKTCKAAHREQEKKGYSVTEQMICAGSYDGGLHSDNVDQHLISSFQKKALAEETVAGP